MNLFDLFATPRQCEIILLDDYPPSADPLTFSRVTWPNYEKIMTRVEMDMVPGQGGVIFTNVEFRATAGPKLVVAYAVMLDDICLFVGSLEPGAERVINPGRNILQCRTILFLSRFPA